MIRAFIIALWLGSAASAQTFPASYAVTDVAANDVLNIREQPSADAAIIGSFAPNAARIEVVDLSDDRRWGKVGIQEVNGWVSMRYLRRTMTNTALPVPMFCFGTEPFWGLSLTETTNKFSLAGEPSVKLTRTATKIMDGTYVIEFSEILPVDRIAVITRQSCNDSMRDREFGFRFDLYNHDIVGGGQFSGCCTLQTSN